MARTNQYDHFCPVARSLEVIGEKWSLLIVRELLGGPQRFTDLQRSMPNITAKWLTLRLRELETAGILLREQEDGRREVRYRLTDRGRDLSGVVGALNEWGLRHAMRPILPGEAVSAARVARSFAGYLNTTGVRTASQGWRLIFDGEPQDLAFSEGRWRRSLVAKPGLTITTTLAGWAAMLTQSPGRPSPDATLTLTGPAAEAARFRETLRTILEPAGA